MIRPTETQKQAFIIEDYISDQITQLDKMRDNMCKAFFRINEETLGIQKCIKSKRRNSRSDFITAYERILQYNLRGKRIEWLGKHLFGVIERKNIVCAKRVTTQKSKGN